MALPVYLERFAREYYRALGSPVALRCLTALHLQDWDYIARVRVNPKDYTDAKEYFLDAQASALLRKCRDLPTSSDREAKAHATWLAGEKSCFRTNERLSPYLEGLTHPGCNEDVYRHVVGIRKIVKAILGPCPSMDSLRPRHGPGATFSDPSVRSTVADKMNSIPSLTHYAYWYLLDWMGTKWGREASQRCDGPVFVKGNRFSTAPKDATQYRPIGAEPSVNVFYQLPYGTEIRHRLKSVGIDLDNGQAIHAQVAREASITGRRATLDVTNASGTLAFNLVKLVLDPDWFEALSSLRSPFTRFHDKVGRRKYWVRLEQFSSMGNGYTFELETLIFYAIVKYTEMCLIDGDDGQTLVYGDDIICNTEIVQPVISILRFFGFEINLEKSFWDGPFRESCGGDYFNGQAVRPYFMKEFPCEPQHFIAAANAVRSTTQEALGSFDVVRRAWFHLLDQIPSGIRCCRGPQGLGDIVIHDDESRWVTRERSQVKYVRVYRPARYRKIPFRLFDPGIVHACALYGVPWSRGFIMPRDAVTGYKVGWMCAWGQKWLPVVQTRGGRESPPSFELKAKSVRYRVARRIV